MNLLKTPLIDSEFLQNLIPQKPPFIMVGKLLHYSEKKIISGFVVPADNLFVFEKRFMAPGLIENMAQTVALHTGYKFYLAQQPAPTGYIGAIKKATVNALPFVGQELETTVEILHDMMGITMVSATVTCEGIVLASSEMKTALAN
ncbi:hypothetical protein Q4603_15640 [Zobellia galactanivorans]|uniref:(3R)-Hydroxymyristoyl-[acyl-carrier-protein] dehydratase n=1 Tax=Zobellia galactanivorans (strain DSM 12802 / CCUG 47099 / CIP 106680 / NCIMB 13871 / Dsij) TaxID=63186 RepID=G0LBJ7_ZOBGA|nr:MULTISPECIES: hypothetical protein [Zobellia]MBU3026410.1 hypothetical protein [Zobellia galactanivorans]MDO6810057.1 hypothetical protein [Zobellia galactanivorans]OWW27103.1 hypothetical protein B4Q04_05350 [Zobellia sp. OII3]CAZ96230.1 (3R)-Hydroxymyristoyl-[acyl-carrier-protein] dehydratase [Zobellia galactanivorans]